MSGAVALVLGLFSQDPSTLDGLPDAAPPAAVAAHPAVRRLVAGHRASIPQLQAALASPSWKVRLGAAFALKDLGFPRTLVGAVDDPHPRVRDFARAVLARPPHDPDSGTRPAPYARDPEHRALSNEMVRAHARLDEGESRERMRAVVADLLAPTVPEEERRAALILAGRERPLALEALAERAQAGETLPALRGLVLLTMGEGPKDLPPALRAAVDAGAAHTDPRVREAALRATGALPDDERVARIARSLGDADPQVRQSAVLQSVDLARRAHEKGDTAAVDLLLARLDAYLAGEANEDAREGVRGVVEKASDDILQERAKLLNGESDGGESPQRYLKVGKALIAVSDREYLLCLARGRGPYIADEAFRELRKEAAAELDAVASLPPAPPPPGPPRERAEPVPVAKPTAPRPAAPPQESRRGAVSAGVLVLAAALIGWFLLRSKRR